MSRFTKVIMLTLVFFGLPFVIRYPVVSMSSRELHLDSTTIFTDLLSFHFSEAKFLLPILLWLLPFLLMLLLYGKRLSQNAVEMGTYIFTRESKRNRFVWQELMAVAKGCLYYSFVYFLGLVSLIYFLADHLELIEPSIFIHSYILFAMQAYAIVITCTLACLRIGMVNGINVSCFVLILIVCLSGLIGDAYPSVEQFLKYIPFLQGNIALHYNLIGDRAHLAFQLVQLTTFHSVCYLTVYITLIVYGIHKYVKNMDIV